VSDELERLQGALGDRCVLERDLGAGGMATVYAKPRGHHPWVSTWTGSGWMFDAE